jgi:hypothetical protein
MTNLAVELDGKTVNCELSARATQALAARTAPLVAEMELYFSCLIRKRVRFPDSPHADARRVRASDQLTLCFRPVMTRACAMSEVEGKPELEAFPVVRPEAFVPKWLRLDFRHGQWSGEFGY